MDKGFGFKNAVLNTRDDTNTQYQVGSVTKQFTSTIILKLAEQGRLSLNDKLSKYFPAYQYATKITIENLLSHTAGIWNYTNDGDFMKTRVERPLSMDSMMLLIKDRPLDFEPGSKYSYSNSGYMLLGYIIEKVTGKKYEQVVRQTIFEPLGMSHSGFDFTHLQSPDKAIGYSQLSGQKGDEAMIVDSSVSFAAGAIYSTTGDLYKWDQSLNTEKILQKSSLEDAFTPRKNKYGLGWSIESIEGHRVMTHDGGIHGFLSSNSVIPSKGITVILLSNSNSSKIDRLKKDVLAILYNKPYNLPERKMEVKLAENKLQQYVGEYQLAPAFTIKVSVVENELKAQATGQPQFDLFASAPDKFFLKVVNAQMDFIRNEKGEVNKLILHQNGQDMPGIKIN